MTPLWKWPRQTRVIIAVVSTALWLGYMVVGLAVINELFPTVEGNADYASIITPRHHARLRTMLQQAQTQGAEVLTIDPTEGKPAPATVGTLGDGASRQMLPTLVFGATSQMQLMQEEIFGPILPVISYERLDDAIAHINSGPRPLAQGQHVVVAAGAAQVDGVAFGGHVLQRPDLAIELSGRLEVAHAEFDAAHSIDPGVGHGRILLKVSFAL